MPSTTLRHTDAAKAAMHVRTPLVPSPVLTALAGREVLLKLDNAQPAGSFKLRGHGHLAQDAVLNGAVELVCSSGGNAGAAVAYAASRLSVRARIVVPTSTPSFMVSRLRKVGASVDVHGDVWDAADAHARSAVDESNGALAYVPPFDDERLWEGIASIADELRDDMQVPPAAVALAVGGGGLFCGTALGLERVGWGRVPIICAETTGAHSFAAMIQARHCVPLKRIESIAKSLGALQVAQKCAEWVFEKERAVRSVVVSDREAVEACSLLATHHRILVEPACGAAVAAVPCTGAAYTHAIRLSAALRVRSAGTAALPPGSSAGCRVGKYPAASAEVAPTQAAAAVALSFVWTSLPSPNATTYYPAAPHPAVARPSSHTHANAAASLDTRRAHAFVAAQVRRNKPHVAAGMGEAVVRWRRRALLQLVVAERVNAAQNACALRSAAPRTENGRRAGSRHAHAPDAAALRARTAMMAATQVAVPTSELAVPLCAAAQPGGE
eukprot:IDg16223t1